MPSDHTRSKKDRHRRTRSRSRSKDRCGDDRRGESKWSDRHDEREAERRIKKECQSPDHSRSHREHTGDRHHNNRSRNDHDRHRHDRERNDDRRRKRHQHVDDSKYEYGKPDQGVKEEEIAEEDKSKPDYGLSGKLADDTNTFRGIVVKYNEPPEARKPKLKWRLYPFKGDEAMPVLHIHRQSGYLLGRDRKVADIPTDHPSCSKQHAVIQFRSVEYTKDDGAKGRRTRPYIIDLGSANGTYINNKRIESQRYVELIEKDTIKFGFSSRDYVILHDNVEVSPIGAAADAD